MAVAEIEQTGTMGDRIRARRIAAGLSLLDLMGEVRNRLPRSVWVTHETLRRYENGQVTEEKADPVLVAAIAEALRCELAELSEPVSEAAKRIREVLLSIPCYSAA